MELLTSLVGDNAAYLIIAGIGILMSERVGKMIPDNATGAWGMARKLFKVLGLYMPNQK